MGTNAAIAGLGITEMGRVYGRTATDFAADALAVALADAGLDAGDVDGLLINANHAADMVPSLQFSLGLLDLTLVNAMTAFGATAVTMLQYAAHAIETGQASVVACLFADAPLTEGTSISRSAYGGTPRSSRGSPACAWPTATTPPRTRCTRWRCADTCTCSGPPTISSGRSRSASGGGRG